MLSYELPHQLADIIGPVKHLIVYRIGYLNWFVCLLTVNAEFGHHDEKNSIKLICVLVSNNLGPKMPLIDSILVIITSVRNGHA